MRSLIITILIIASFNSIGQNNIDSLWGIWNDKSRTDVERLKAMDDIAWNGYLFTFPDSAFYYAQMEYELAESLTLTNGSDNENGLKYMSRALNTQGVSFAITGNNAKAIIYYKQGLEITEKIGDESGIAAALNNIGNTYKDQGDYANAIDYYTKSLVLQEKNGNLKGAAATHGNIGIVHYMQENYPMAIEHHKASLEIELEIGNSIGVSNCYGNMGLVYSKMKDYKKALSYHQRSLDLELTLNSLNGVGLTYMNIGNIYEYEAVELLLAKGNQDSISLKQEVAIGYYEKSIETFEETKNTREIAANLVNIAKIYLIKKNFQKAKGLSEESMTLARSIDARIQIRDASKVLYEVYKELKMHKESLAMHELYIATHDSIDSEENRKEVLRQEYKYAYEKQVSADSLIQVEAKKLTDAKIDAQNAQLANEKNQRFSLYGGVIVLMLFGVIMYSRFRITRKQKIIIETQKLEVETQKEYADKQRLAAEIQTALVEEKNKEILDSISYAKRIQNALLPSDKIVADNLMESFVLYKPKDIVAGDFYWLESIGDKVLYAAADCTGHGVPGAMVSVICNNALNRSVKEFGLVEPGAILDKAREIVIKEFDKSDEDVKDGMDIALCSLEGNELKYAGAHNPLWIIRNGEVIETKANKQPIGKFDNLQPYTTHLLHLEKGDSIYIFSDGYVDQFGGPKGKKYKSKAFKELLVSIQNRNMEDQKIIINESFDNWKGSTEQIDDVCVIGVRI